MANTVLVVDDSPPVRQQVGMALEAAGYEVVEARDGADALECLKSNKVSMVVCDVNMPKMNGIEFLEKVGRSVPVVMLTTEGQAELKRTAKALGARGWIIKPFNADMLVEAVRHIVGA